MGEIIVHREHDQWTGRTRVLDYSWYGGPYAYVDARLFETEVHAHPTVFAWYTVGQYRVRVVDFDEYRDSYLVARNGLPGRAFMLKYRTLKQLQKINIRLLVTLSVWGLSTWHFGSGEEPTWGHVRRRFSRHNGSG